MNFGPRMRQVDFEGSVVNDDYAGQIVAIAVDNCVDAFNQPEHIARAVRPLKTFSPRVPSSTSHRLPSAECRH